MSDERKLISHIICIRSTLNHVNSFPTNYINLSFICKLNIQLHIQSWIGNFISFIHYGLRYITVNSLSLSHDFDWRRIFFFTGLCYGKATNLCERRNGFKDAKITISNFTGVPQVISTVLAYLKLGRNAAWLFFFNIFCIFIVGFEIKWAFRIYLLNDEANERIWEILRFSLTSAILVYTFVGHRFHITYMYFQHQPDTNVHKIQSNGNI